MDIVNLCLLGTLTYQHPLISPTSELLPGYERDPAAWGPGAVLTSPARLNLYAFSLGCQLTEGRNAEGWRPGTRTL